MKLLPVLLNIQETDKICAYLIYDSQIQMIFMELKLTYFIKTEVD